MKTPRWAKGAVIMALLGWLGLAIVSYLSLPMFQTIWWFSKLMTAAAWIPAALWSFTAVMTYLTLKAYVRSFAVLVIAVLLGVVIFRIDWQALYIDSQFKFHRDEFAALAAENKLSRPLTVPWWMKYLSLDGQVRHLPVFEDT
ncbi:hypothetical protein [Acrocarpospora pleiomorpha]|nr:hypothetical protein [Acrocarpospora pleiomorpha]